MRRPRPANLGAAFGVSLVLVCGVASGAGQQTAARVTLSDETMGTTFSVVLEGDDPEFLSDAGRAALDEAQRLDRLLSHYRADSELTHVNRNAAAAPVAVSDELFVLLEKSMAYSRASGGAFDVTVAPLMRAWGFFRDEGALPTRDAIAGARSSVGFEHVELDASRRTVRFQRPGVELDPGGIGKGYAVDRMAALLRLRGVTAALISAGGSTLYGLGAPADSPDGWSVTIRDPNDPHRSATDARLRDRSLSTSGSYERFFFAGGRRYSHILDPRTGYPAQGTSSVSVVAPSALDSEVWAKPYFVNGREWTRQHMPAGWRVYYCDDGFPARCGWLPR